MRECSKTSNNILWIHDPSVNQEKVGGKAKNLNILNSLGINVPNAFFLTSDFFDTFAEKTNLNLHIENLLAKLDKTNIKEISKNIRNEILGLSIPQIFISEIFSFFKKAKFKKVSVRSSAVGEDGTNNAFAGMLDSYLNVDENRLIDSIKKCWSSLFNERCLSYKLAKKLNKSSSMAIVVQEMIDSDFSGVAFSKNPISLKNEILVEYCKGLGENLVSGKVTPDKVIVDYKIKEKSISNENSYNKVKANIKELCQNVDKIKKFYKYDVDIEFAIAHGELYILQCRPITTLNNLQNLIYKNKWEFYVKRPFCWLFESFQKLAFDSRQQKKILGFNLSTNNYFILDGMEYYVENDHSESLKIFETLYNADKNFFNKYAICIFEIINKAQTYTKLLGQCDYKKLSKNELVEHLKIFKDNYLTTITPTFARPDDYLEQKFTSELDSIEAFNSTQKSLILSSLVYYPRNYAPLDYTDAILSILKISQKKAEGKDIALDLEEHITKYSWMKGSLNKKLQAFTWAEYLKDIESLVLADSYKCKLENNKTKTKESIKQVEKAIGFLKNYPELLQLYNIIRDFIYLRTKLSEVSDYMFYIFRTGLLKEVGERITLRDKDIVALSVDEILDRLLNNTDYSNLINDRKVGYCLLKSNGIWYDVFGMQAQKISKPFKMIDKKIKNRSVEREIYGQVATQGYIVGKVKIINSLKDLSKIETNDIIVSSMTTPEYASAIEKAGGFITNEGGITCHAAIISREFNIPCVVGTKNATTLLNDGQKVELDAFNGIIRY